MNFFYFDEITPYSSKQEQSDMLKYISRLGNYF